MVSQLISDFVFRFFYNHYFIYMCVTRILDFYFLFW